MNGYFNLVITDKGTALKVYPPTDGGENLDVNIVRDYLDDLKIEYDVVVINDAVTEASGEPVFFNEAKIMPVRENYRLDVSKDKMTVTAVFYPPSEGAELMTEDEVIKDLQYRKITYGVDVDAIHEFFLKRDYCKEIVIAKGLEVREGHNAYVEYKFNVNLRPKPTLREDGSVDYFHLNLINNCEEGDVLAILHMEDRGDPGINIYNDAIKPHTVKSAILKYGKNVNINEEKTELTAATSGHVTLKEGKVTVSNVMTLENVDVSTGNIEYEGSVQVNGIVASGFSIKAGGNIHIKGIVEGAELNSGADVILERGINGMGKGKITAEGNLVTKFIENATVQVKGSVTSESIMHATIFAGTEVNVSGRKGFIAGGRVCAGEKVSAKALGSEMGANTLIEVGVDPTLKIRMKELQKGLVEAQKKLETIKPTLEGITKKIKSGAKFTPEQLQYAQQVNLINKTLNQKIAKDSEEFTQLQEKFADSKNAEVLVEDNAYPGITVTIGEMSMVVKKNVKYSRFVLKDGDVKITPF
ncbi:MAG: FapA family protein [Butyrivibrio sp.]|nr:FapA family protein [Butyrivibrio sp.]